MNVFSDGDSASVEKKDSDDAPDANKTSTGIWNHCRNDSKSNGQISVGLALFIYDYNIYFIRL